MIEKIINVETSIYDANICQACGFRTLEYEDDPNFCAGEYHREMRCTEIMAQVKELLK